MTTAQSEVQPASTAPATYELAGFWARTAAFLVDSWILIVAAIPVAFLGGDFFGPINTVFAAIYFPYLWSVGGDTLGMRWLGLRVVRMDDKPFTHMDGVIRFVGLSLATAPFYLGLIWAAFDSKKQGWHDKLAKTQVVKLRPTNGPLVVGVLVCISLLTLAALAVVLAVVFAYIMRASKPPIA